MPAMIAPRETLDLIESTAVSFKSSPESTVLHAGSLQNPTEWRCDSPFFGSVLSVSSVMHFQSGMAGDQKGRIKDRAHPQKKKSFLELWPLKKPTKVKRLG